MTTVARFDPYNVHERFDFIDLAVPLPLPFVMLGPCVSLLRMAGEIAHFQSALTCKTAEVLPGDRVDGPLCNQLGLKFRTGPRGLARQGNIQELSPAATAQERVDSRENQPAAGAIGLVADARHGHFFGFSTNSRIGLRSKGFRTKTVWVPPTAV